MEDNKVLKGFIICFEVATISEEDKYKSIFIAEYTPKGAIDLFYRWYDTQFKDRPLKVFITPKRFKKAQKSLYNEDYMKRQLEHIIELERNKHNVL